MAHYTFPSDYEETFRCDYCEEDFLEDDLVEIERNKWACAECNHRLYEEHMAMRETADDDMAHAARDRAAGL